MKREREKERGGPTLWWWSYEQKERVITTACVTLEFKSHSSWEHGSSASVQNSWSLALWGVWPRSRVNAPHTTPGNQWQRIELLHHKWKRNVTSHILPNFSWFRNEKITRKKQRSLFFGREILEYKQGYYSKQLTMEYLSFFCLTHRESLSAAKSSTCNLYH